jgi:coenzyme F420-0:L-glutamate ligase/coenzyme F420-1:gamma-L-glutamate ligase
MYNSTMTPSNSLILTGLADFPLVQPGEDLGAMIVGSLRHNQQPLMPGDILVVAQKIVSKAEARLVVLDTVTPSQEAKALAEETEKDPRVVELILRESTAIARVRPGLIISEHRLGLVLANAGIDQSNIDHSRGDSALLLPEAPDASADLLRETLQDTYDVPVGVIINDSLGRPWREGTTGHAIGYAGIHGLADQVGDSDLHGRALTSTLVAWADELAAAASFVMGQAAEARPVVLIRGAAIAVGGSGNFKELLRPADKDLFKDWPRRT